MATPPTSGGLFFSSSPVQRDDDDLNEQVDSAFDKARQVIIIDPELKEIFSQNKTVITTFLKRRIQLIASRSQDWKDGQVTVFDKVLLKLTQDGKELNSPGVMSYFCKEFLGIFDQADTDEKRTILSDSIAASVALSPSTARLGSFSESLEANNFPKRNGTFREEGSITNNHTAIISQLASELEPITGRLWTVYAEAKHELAESSGLRKKESAKFLRDTAENLLYRLQDMSVDERLTEEVATTLQSATLMTTSLHGGRKRKFDQSPDPSNRSLLTNRQPIKTAERPEKARDEKRHKRRDSGEVFLGRSRSVDRYRFKNREQDWIVQGNEAGHTSRNSQNPKKKSKGRGHSGIPYGYTRPVDSYYPD